MRIRGLAGLLVLALVWPGIASAAEGFNSHLFHPSPFAGRFLTFEDAQTMPQFRWALGALIDYANAPVEVRENNDRVSGVVDGMLSTDLTGSFSAHEMVNVGLHVPIHWFNRSRTFDDLGDADGISSRQNRTSMGDIRLLTKVRILEEGMFPFGVAVTPFVTFPTGDADAMLGDGRMTYGLTGTYEINLAWVRMGLSGGWRYRGRSGVLDTQVRNAFPLAVGVTRDITDRINVSLELHGEMYESENNRDFAGNPLELDAVGRWRMPQVPGLRIIGGGGPGVTSGVGSPDFRLFAGVDYRPEIEAKPPPSTGHLRIVVQDTHGVPLEAEVGLEGAELRLGNTTDGTFAVTDLAPGTYQVRVSRPDFETGLAEAQIFAGQSATVTVVLYPLETRLTVIVLDKDKGHRLDSRLIFNPGAADEKVVENPSGEYTEAVEPGTIPFTAVATGYEAVLTKADVQAHETTTITVRLRRKIEKSGRIFFDLDSADLRPISKPVLREIANKITQINPKQVIVEGHCSDEGTDEYNMKLSQRRAESVQQFLVAQGVAANVLTVAAFGESRPIATNETEEGRERNRRVEFIIEGGD
ncbi:MAG: OmpA family protein [Candidatus Lernaella stagnicola]|nr:OmpA family protein [Candidatus Lernaella stagnicola]